MRKLPFIAMAAQLENLVNVHFFEDKKTGSK